MRGLIPRVVAHDDLDLAGPRQLDTPGLDGHFGRQFDLLGHALGSGRRHTRLATSIAGESPHQKSIQRLCGLSNLLGIGNPSGIRLTLRSPREEYRGCDERQLELAREKSVVRPDRPIGQGGFDGLIGGFGDDLADQQVDGLNVLLARVAAP